MNIVGRAANVLFGVCDDIDAEYFYSKINELENSKSRIFQISESPTQIMQSIISDVNSSLLELENS